MSSQTDSRHQLVQEKLGQAVRILDECGIDCWLTFVRESSINKDPVLPFLCHSQLTWHSALVVTRSGSTHAIVGQLEKQSIDDLGVYSEVVGYVEGIRRPLQKLIQKIEPNQIAVNFSTDSEVCDGLTHGMFLLLEGMLQEIGCGERLVSAENIVSRLRARKSETEISRIRAAIDHTTSIFAQVADFIRPGKSEKEIASFIAQQMQSRKLKPAWAPEHCPAVFTGPDTAEAHYQPTHRRASEGHVLNIDFGVKVEDYCSDLQRTFYLLEPGQTSAPPEVQKGFETIVAAIELARKAMTPGVQGRQIDAVGREYIVGQGYDEFPHALGHQVGRHAHDGTALLGPTWEKYASKPLQELEAGMVFTIEPRLKVPQRGTVTIEEMVLVTNEGADFLSPPQTELLLISPES